jgi:L-2-hydroxyglutarate oxidase LhgO
VTERVDVAVIGGGIVGLAAARAVLHREPDVRLCVLEKEPELARHQTGRNSGVVHAGIYYPPGSLKARLCAAGRAALREYTAERGLPYVECGKVIVATREEQLPGLQELLRRATANGVPGVRLLDSAGLREVEPAVHGLAALHSPFTAITDYGAISRSFGADVEKLGGSVRTGFSVQRVSQDVDSVTLVSRRGDRVEAGRVLVCAGLYGDRIAVLAGDDADPRIVPFRGDYFTLAGTKAGSIRGLVYPVPDPSLPFLGVHLTRTVHGDVLVGPNAILATAREGYRLADVRPGELAQTLAWPGFWRFGRRYWRVGWHEIRRATNRRLFAAEAAQYVPGITPADLSRARSGVRAQALDRAGNLVDDFVLTRVGRVVNVRNAPSPAATSSLPIGEELALRLLGDDDRTRSDMPGR